MTRVPTENTPIDGPARAPYFALAVYAVAMGFLEAVVVVYLRKLYHPEGFKFPLRPIEPDMALTELAREAATVAMIWTVAHLSGRTTRERFAAFAFVFGVWDISYYGWLRVAIGWPQSLLDPDVLFLIPAPWVGPVLAPVLVSIHLIALAFLLSPLRPSAAPPPPIKRIERALYLAGAALILWTFLVTNLPTASLDSPVYYPGLDPDHPRGYPWEVFAAGYALGAAATARIAVRRDIT